MTKQFDHEKLEVYQASVRFTAWAETIYQLLPARSVRDQLDRASTSIPLNIAEGNAKFSIKDRCRFLDIARGSAVECSACLDVAVAKGFLDCSQIEEGKEALFSIVSMLMALNNSLVNRLREDGADYVVEILQQGTTTN